jgi:hypothetical protein
MSRQPDRRLRRRSGSEASGGGAPRRRCERSRRGRLDVHPRVAMLILRHSTIAITMEIYTEVPDARTRKALRRLGDSLDG